LYDILHPEFDQIAASEFAVDSQVEKRVRIPRMPATDFTGWRPCVSRMAAG